MEHKQVFATCSIAQMRRMTAEIQPGGAQLISSLLNMLSWNVAPYIREATTARDRRDHDVSTTHSEFTNFSQVLRILD